MNGRLELTVPIDVAAPAALVWEVVTDWAGQGSWILATRVALTGGDGRSVGSTVRAVTGVGPFGVVDTMEITEWAEQRPAGPFRCVVTHTGRVIRGDGVFEVVERGPSRSRFFWTESLDLPLGALGRAARPVVSPLLRVGIGPSLRALARECERRARAAR